MKTTLMYLMKLTFLVIFCVLFFTWNIPANTGSAIAVILAVTPFLFMEILGLFTLVSEAIRMKYMTILNHIYYLLSLLYVLTGVVYDCVEKASAVSPAWIVLGVISLCFAIITPCKKETSEDLFNIGNKW